MRETGGDFAAAASILDISKNRLYHRVYKSPKLTAALKGKIVPLTEEDTYGRKPDGIVLPNPGEQLTATQLKVNFDKMYEALEEAGIDPAVLKPIRSIEKMLPEMGEAISASIGMTHHKMFHQIMKLGELGASAHRDALNETNDDEVRIEWARVTIDVTKVTLDAYDRMMQAAMAMAKLMGQDSKSAGKAKPGFKPLRRVS